MRIKLEVEFGTRLNAIIPVVVFDVFANVGEDQFINAKLPLLATILKVGVACCKKVRNGSVV